MKSRKRMWASVFLFLLVLPFCYANSLTFYESFENTESFNANSCIVCSIPEFSGGVKGNSAFFSNQYLTYPVSENINKNSGTLSFWVKSKTGSNGGIGGSGGFFDYGELSTTSSFAVFKPAWESYYLEFISDIRSYAGQMSTSVNSTNWNYITIVWRTNINYSETDASYFKYYLNGQLIGTRIFNGGYDGTKIFNFNPTDNYFSVGRSGWYGNANSYMDELKIYDYEKTPTEIFNDYKNYTGNCLLNSECGTDGFKYSRICQGNDVYQPYFTYTCNNPGGIGSYCTETGSLRLFEECLNECIYGLCKIDAIKPVSTGNIKIIGRDLIVDGKRFVVKSVGYAPVPIGSNPEWGYDVTVHPELRARDFPILRKMGANTIRTWGKVNQMSFLDDAWNNGDKPIRVIMGYWMGSYDIDYSNEITRNNIKEDFRNYVNTYKNHPGVLVWAIGNEENHFYGTDNTRHAAYFSLVNEMAQIAYETEGANYHPVMAIALEFPNRFDTIGNSAGGSDDSKIPYVDMWGINHYPGKAFDNFFNNYQSRSSKPLIITEYGIDAYNHTASKEYESVQAKWEVDLWKEIENNGVVGGSLMEYSDEYWKGIHSTQPAGNCPDANINLQSNCGYSTTSHPDFFSDEEYWGIVRMKKNPLGGVDIAEPRQAYYALANEWRNMQGDINLDCSIDIFDVAKIQVCYGGTATLDCASSDLNNDGNVDIFDVTILQVNYGKKCDDTLAAVPANAPLPITQLSSMQQIKPDNKCKDSDNGKDYFKLGTTTKGDVVKKDSCVSGKVKEYFCNKKGNIESTLYKCGKGYSCKDGICAK